VAGDDREVSRPTFDKMIIDQADKSEYIDVIKQAMADSITMDHGMTVLLSYCKSIVSSPIWDQLNDLDYQRDSSLLSTWLESLLRSIPPGSNIVAFWFGLFVTVVNQEETMALYLSGSTKYDKHSADWACWDEESYTPDNGYLYSNVLAKIYRVTSQNDEPVSDLGVNLLCLGYTCLSVWALCQTVTSLSRIATGREIAIAVGFDDGDYINLGIVGPRGIFTPDI
jgi:hypothetical protein